ANPTIYEYLINLSIFMSFNCEINQFKENCNTILDSKLKPRSHAPGGKSDGIAINKKGKPFATIEATIISNFEQILKNEQTSIQRHSFEYFQKLKITPSIIFVINKIDNNKEQLINRFVSKRYSSYFNDEEILIKTIVLTIEEMIKYIEHKCLDKIENIFDKVPIDFEANKSNNKYKMYADILNDIIN
ncbi:AlwI family type II restriction endonuclease, partial [bacterium]|nr:AlwI family type II restriction endonuclease [bacterium]